MGDIVLYLTERVKHKRSKQENIVKEWCIGRVIKQDKEFVWLVSVTGKEEVVYTIDVKPLSR